MIIVLVCSVLIWSNNPLLQFSTREEKLTASLIVATVCLCIVMLDDSYVRGWRWFISLRFIQAFRKKAGIQPEQINPYESVSSGIIKTIRLHLYKTHGGRWRHKVRILLVTGHVSDVEQLTPGLTSQYWQEDQGTLLIWGGDPAQSKDLAWLTALRQLRSRPLDGLVWVTGALTPSRQNDLTEDSLDRVSASVHALYDALGWRVPMYVWSLQQADADAVRVTQPVGCMLPAGCDPATLETRLMALIPGLITQGIRQVCGAPQHHFLLSLADRLSQDTSALSGPLASLLTPYRAVSLAGVVFSPATVGGERSVKHHWRRDNRWDALPETVAELPAGLRPRRTGVNWQKGLHRGALVLMLSAGIASIMAFAGNRSLVAEAREQVLKNQDHRQPATVRLQALYELQKTLARLQYRAGNGVPWYLRAGLSQNDALLHTLLPHYEQRALPLLRDAAAVHLAQQLQAFISTPPDSPQRSQRGKKAYDQLKLYLMLAEPARMDPAWFSSTLARVWEQRDGVSGGFWQAHGTALMAFYGEQMQAHPEWAVTTEDSLVSQSRSLLVRQMGVRNSDATLYQNILVQVARHYADIRLADMVGDTDASRLFSTEEVVPGMFSRQAWEQVIQPAVEKVVSVRRNEMDWVLSDGTQPVDALASPEALQQRLTERYFADFAGAWSAFLNSLRWQQAETLSDAIEQLTLLADIRQSPLVALMNTLSIQGRTGQSGEALSDSLVKSAKNLFSRDSQPVIDPQGQMRGPLDDTFGPLLALMDSGEGESAALSLQTWLSRVTQVRLRLQQITNAADPQAMTQALARTVFQGRAVDLTETRDYGNLIAAGLGQEWSGFGQTVFVRPMEQAWQQVLSPAADSLNRQWRSEVLDEWNRDFAGRYPFRPVSTDASLPLLAQYLNADAGYLPHFLKNQLDGVLKREGRRWVPDKVNAQGLTFNPAFLDAINTLSQVAEAAFPRGTAGMTFELRPGTAAGVVQTGLIIDGQHLNYMNQMPAWSRFSWPADTQAPGASLSWISTQAGTRQYAELPGSWGIIRLLESAHSEPYPGLGSSYALSWTAQDGRKLNYTLKTEHGEGPLALLKLRNFTLPENIFILRGKSVKAGSLIAEGEGNR